MYYYNGAQRYEHFLQVGRLYRALILLVFALCLQSASVSSVFMVLYRYIFLLKSFSLLFTDLSKSDWSFTWLTNHRPSVLCRCWFCHMTRKIVSEMICVEWNVKLYYTVYLLLFVPYENK